ncbi:Cof-type HAD-IIB family hydrolase [uncultured Enterococcus sp.]|uniref:Cof-type HAD-IIB family hydrolase n=1 Tax=uncultured Enterococcus sp. TaxID=167972 RepID=UPI0025EB273E|nr:HAD family hydrolase [uncultured Enterococcus sp.]
MQKKYFFFDIDGTLTDRATNEIIPSAKQALEELQQKGHFVAIATGRAHYKARPIMERLGLHNMVCAGGGAIVVDDQLISNRPLALEKAKQIAIEADSLGLGVLFATKDSDEVISRDELFIKQVGKRQEPTTYRIDSKLAIEELEQIYKLYIALPQTSKIELTTKELLPSLYYVPEYLMYQIDEKDRGIRELMAYLHAPTEDVVVFGDDTNDLVMFGQEWFSIAMGNGTKALKDKADYITATNLEDGIYKACQHFGWI